MRAPPWALVLAALLVGCETPPPADTDTAVEETDPPVFETVRSVFVTLDGAPAEGVLVMQGGTQEVVRTGADGRAEIVLRTDVAGDIAVIASHPEARVGSVEPDATGDLEIDLLRYDPTDNEDYVFRDPGEPDRSPSTNQCGHCHVTINEGWSESVHRGSASNPWVLDLYSGSASSLDQAACIDAGGRWSVGPVPGSDETAPSCYLGAGALPDVDPDCDQAPCPETPDNVGSCAACHAPAINGRLQGRGLLEARERAYDYGVQCDVCHKVEAVELDHPLPGVAGRLHLHRPSEPDPTFPGEWRPMYFGPNHDSPNAFMGSVQRDHYTNGLICAGCHEYEQEAQLPGGSLDADRWPSGRLPVLSTWTEWEEGPLSPEVACNACHMPPAPWALNSADLQLFGGARDAGIVGGFVRPPGTVRQHTWVGPSSPESGMLQVSAALDVRSRVQDGVLEATVTTTNVGAGHRIPTAEPSRAMVLRVSATCEGAALAPVGGDVVPLFVGAVHEGSVEDLDGVWPNAQEGDHMVVLRAGGPVLYEGFGPFGDGTFTDAEKGLVRWSIVDRKRVTGVDDGRVSLDGELAMQDGDRLVLTRDNGTDEAPVPMAGQPGFAFARVLADAEGRLMVPHHLAVDVVSDNRLAPHQSFTTTHRFAAPCDDPVVTASLRYRRHPAWLVAERGWALTDVLVQEVSQ